jgi:hypothetical protein
VCVEEGREGPSRHASVKAGSLAGLEPVAALVATPFGLSCAAFERRTGGRTLGLVVEQVMSSPNGSHRLQHNGAYSIGCNSFYPALRISAVIYRGSGMSSTSGAAPSPASNTALSGTLQALTTSLTSSSMRSLGEDLWKRMEKGSGDLLLQLYGSFMRSMWKEFQDPRKMTAYQLKFSKDIGSRLADEFFARSGIGRCRDLKESAEVITKAAFKMFLNITPAISDFSADSREYSLVFEEDPLTENVVLPDYLVRGHFHYSSGFYAGAIQGAYEAIGIQVECSVLSDKLLGDDKTVVRVFFARQSSEPKPPEDDDA